MSGISFICAEGFSVDTMTGRVTAFNIVDSLLVSALPSMLIRANAIATYELGPEADAFKERIRLLSPSNAVLAESASDVALAARGRAGEMPSCHRSVHVFWKTTITEPGDHRLVLERFREAGEWEELSSVRIPVVVKKHELLNMQAPQIAATTGPRSDQT